MRSPLSMLVALVLPTMFVVGMFLVGRLFIRRPELPTRFFTFGMNPESKFGLWWFRFTGYLFCVVSVGFIVLIPLYLIALFHRMR
jgi:hypothetical protein